MSRLNQPAAVHDDRSEEEIGMGDDIHLTKSVQVACEQTYQITAVYDQSSRKEIETEEHTKRHKQR